MTSYIDSNGKKTTPVPAESIMVASKSDLADLECPPATIAFTAGFAEMWQLAADGTWQAIIEEGGN